LRETIVGAIRYYGETMALSYSANNAMWPATKKAIQTHKSGFSDWAGDENISEWSDVVKNFENVFIARLDGMNTLISQFPE
jgi:hypothetical protein